MTDLATLAADVGARDVFVLRRVAADQLINLDGVGRGSGWAGNVCLDPADEPWLTGVLAEGRGQHRTAIPSNLFGPYWTSEAVAEQVGDYVVVMGGEGVTSVEGGLIAEAVRSAASSVGEVSAEKRMADELEISQATLSVATLPPAGMDETAPRIAGLAASALSCEFGAVLVVADEPRAWLTEEGWRPGATTDEVVAALLPLAAAASGTEPVVEQDLSQSPDAYPPLSASDGLVSRCVVPIGTDRWTGLLVTAHSGAAPRGFTDLCRRVATSLGAAATPVLDAAMLRDALR